MSAYSLCLTTVVLLAAAFEGYAQTALSDWTPGVATNYGGTASGMDPTQASYGLSNVSTPSLLTFLFNLTADTTFCASITLIASQYMNHSTVHALLFSQ